MPLGTPGYRSDVSYQVTIEPLGESVEVEEGQSILDAALRAGIWLPYACNHGLCGTCKVEVLEGAVLVLRRRTIAFRQVAFA